MDKNQIGSQKAMNSRMKQAHDRIYELQQAMEEMESRQGVNWADVGDAGRLVDGLDEILAWAANKEV